MLWPDSPRSSCQRTLSRPLMPQRLKVTKVVFPTCRGRQTSSAGLHRCSPDPNPARPGSRTSLPRSPTLPRGDACSTTRSPSLYTTLRPFHVACALPRSQPLPRSDPPTWRALPRSPTLSPTWRVQVTFEEGLERTFLWVQRDMDLHRGSPEVDTRAKTRDLLAQAAPDMTQRGYPASRFMATAGDARIAALCGRAACGARGPWLTAKLDLWPPFSHSGERHDERTHRPATSFLPPSHTCIFLPG